eukprot:5000521-Alexandrium_andersonii.AAC.1
MSASLVGSEMCIRDRSTCRPIGLSDAKGPHSVDRMAIDDFGKKACTTGTTAKELPRPTASKW